MTHASHHGAPRHACANAVSGLTTRQNRTRRALSCTLSAAKVQPTTTLLGSLRSAKRGLHTALQSIHATNCASDVLAATNRGPAWARRRTWRASTSSNEDATHIIRCAVTGATTSSRATTSHDARRGRQLVLGFYFDDGQPDPAHVEQHHLQVLFSSSKRSQ